MLKRWTSLRACCAAFSIIAMQASPVIAQDDPPELPPELQPIEEIAEDLDAIQELYNLIESLPELPDGAQTLDDLDAETRQRVDEILSDPVFDTVQDNAVLNGELTDAIIDVLGTANIRPYFDQIEDALPTDVAEDVFNAIRPWIDAADMGINVGALIADMAVFRFVTESGGVTRTHAGVANVPIPLDVDDRLGPDVIAQFGMEETEEGGLSMEMEVIRILDAPRDVILADALVPPSLPLDLRAQIDIPLSRIWGADAPDIRVEVGFISESDIAERAVSNVYIERNFVSEVSGQDEKVGLEAGVSWDTHNPGDDLAIVVNFQIKDQFTDAFKEYFEYRYRLSDAVPAEMNLLASVMADRTWNNGQPVYSGYELTAGAYLSEPATAHGIIDILEGIAIITLTFDQQPEVMDVTINSAGIHYRNSSRQIEELSVRIQALDRIDILVGIEDLPTHVNLILPDADYRGMKFNFDGMAVGSIFAEIGIDAKDRSAGAVPESENGVGVHLLDGVSLGFRFIKGFKEFELLFKNPFGAIVRFEEEAPFVVDVDVTKNITFDFVISNIPTEFGALFGYGNLVDVNLFASRKVDHVEAIARINDAKLTARLGPIPSSAVLCITRNNGGCTGKTDGGIIDMGFYLSDKITGTLDVCVKNCNATPSRMARVELTSLKKVEFSADTWTVKKLGVKIPHGGGKILFNTDRHPIEIDSLMKWDNTRAGLYFRGKSEQRVLKWDASKTLNPVSINGYMGCDKLDTTLVINGVNLESKFSWLKLDRILCSGL